MTERKAYRNKWVTDNAWIQAIYESTMISSSCEITACEINTDIPTRNSPICHNSFEHFISPLHSRTLQKNSSFEEKKVNDLETNSILFEKARIPPAKAERQQQMTVRSVKTVPKAVLR